MTRLVSIVVPVYNEGVGIVSTLERLSNSVSEPHEVLVVHDTEEDSTVPYVRGFGRPEVRAVHNTYGPGPANAIRFGLDAAGGDVGVVTMADSSDDPTQIDSMADLVRAGNVVVAASRYMPGGSQVGGPLVKRTMSRLAGVSLYHLARVGTRDATNSFKAYDLGFVRSVGIESDAGFEIGIELVAKARRHRKPVAEIPTQWLDRTEGESRFRVAAWTPKYLRWWFYSFGRELETEESMT